MIETANVFFVSVYLVQSMHVCCAGIMYNNEPKLKITPPFTLP